MEIQFVIATLIGSILPTILIFMLFKLLFGKQSYDNYNFLDLYTSNVIGVLTGNFIYLILMFIFSKILRTKLGLYKK